MAQLAHDQRQRFCALAEHRVAHRAHCGQRHQQVDQRAADHRADDADRQVAARVLGLLGRGGDGVEAVEGEEDDRRGRHDAALHAGRIQRLREAERHERLQVVRIERRQRDRDEHRQCDQLEHHQDRVERGALARAGHQQAGDRERDEDRRQVDDAARVRTRGKGGGQGDVPAEVLLHPLQEPDEVAGPAHGHGADHQRILQDQAPADDPGDGLAQHAVAVGVGAARGRHHRRQFGIGQCRAGADHAGDDEGQQHGGTGLVRTHADQRVDARAHDGADAQRDQVRPAQRGHQSAPLFVLGDPVDGFAP